MFNNRLNVVFDWYKRDTKGMLAPGMELPGILERKLLYKTLPICALMDGTLSLDWHDRRGKVDYYIGFNLYDAKTKITKYDNAVGLFGKDSRDKLIYRTGMELGEIWGFVTDRLYQESDFNADGSLKEGLPKVEGYNPKPDAMYKDFDGNGIINQGKKTVR